MEPITTLLDIVGSGSGGNWHTTYAPIPHYITTWNRSLVLENTEYAAFDFRSDDVISVSVANSSIVARIITAASPIGLIEEYTNYCGRMPVLPDWILNGMY